MLTIAIQTLRDEGVLDIGGIRGTSFVYVITAARMCLFHAAELPRRRLDDYGAHCAVRRIEGGSTSRRVALDLGVTEPELQAALVRIGYVKELRDPRSRRRARRRRISGTARI